MIDQEKFAVQMVKLSSCLKGEIDPIAYDTYYELIGHVSLNQLETAVMSFIRDEKYVPTPTEILAYIKPLPEQLLIAEREPTVRERKEQWLRAHYHLRAWTITDDPVVRGRILNTIRSAGQEGVEVYVKKHLHDDPEQLKRKERAAALRESDNE